MFGFFCFNQWSGFVNQRQAKRLMVSVVNGEWCEDGWMYKTDASWEGSTAHISAWTQPKFKDSRTLKNAKNIQHEKSFWLTTSGRAESVRGRPAGPADGGVADALNKLYTQK